MLAQVRYFPPSEVESHLRGLLLKLCQRADTDGIPRDCVTVLAGPGDGESGHAILELADQLNTHENLNLTIFRGNAIELQQMLKSQSASILAFLDDFAGSGQTFKDSIGVWSGAFSTTVVPLFTTIVMCPEAIPVVREAGAEAIYSVLHPDTERFKSIFTDEDFAILSSYALELHSKTPLGHKKMGCMTVLSRNSNNNMPFLLRGTKGQRVWYGLFPRHDQLHPLPYER